ncbi:MAG: DUF4091 domain-containing protein, partial [Firmicutes bacterium]|nr:DUF4091 domain-containing protein [Bacillota bacterium]
YLINNVIYQTSGGAKPAMRAVLPLLAVLALLLLVRPWLALGRGARLAVGVPVLSAILVSGGIVMRGIDFGGVHGLGADTAWTFAYSGEKIQQEQRLGRRKAIHLTMGKNEREGFQFILRGRNGSALQYCIELSDITGEDGAAIPVRMFKEYYIQAGTGKDAGVYPDALVPYPLNQNTLEITGERRNQGYYFELRTAADTPAGVYTGKITVSQRREKDGYVWETVKVLAQAEFTVEVVDAAFPEAPYSDSAVGVANWSERFCALGGVEPGTPEHEALYKQYYDTLLDHKLSAYNLPYDILDERADEYMSDPRVKSITLPYPEDDARLQAYYQKVQSNPEWARKAYFYPIDEPHTAEQIATYNAMAERLAALCPGYHMVTPFYTWKFSEGGGDYDNLAIQEGRSDIICPQSNLYDRSGFPKAVAKRVKNGGRAWWYVCCGPTGDYCNMFTHLQGTRHRLLFWQQYQQNVTGLLYWSTTYWEKANPWFSSVTWNSFEACGDGSWFYPGPAVGLTEPVPSLRLKNIADGLEDYDLLRMAEEKFGREYCLEKAAQLSKSLTNYTGDPAKIEQVRVSILKDLAA